MTKDKILDLYWKNITNSLNKNKTNDERLSFFLILIFIFISVFIAYKIDFYSFAHNKYIKIKKIMLGAENIEQSWDLSKKFYNSTEDENIDKDINLIDKKIENFLIKYKNVIEGKANHILIKKSIFEFENISKMIYKLSLYSYLLLKTDSKNESYLKLYSKINKFNTKWDVELNSYLIYLSKINDLKTNALLKDKEIKPYFQFIKNAKKYKNHIFSNEMENFATEKSATTDDLLIHFYDKKLSNLKINLSGKHLTLEEALNIMNYSSSSSKRKNAYNAINKIFQENAEDILYVFNSRIGSKNVSDKYRKYQNSYSQRHLENNVSEKEIQEMINTVELNYKNTSHKYYAIKAKLMKQENLHYYDRNVSLNASLSNFNYSFEESKNLILNTLKEFSPEIYETGKVFFDENLIDIYPKNGKSGGAFCTHYNTMILMNFQENLNSILTLAHELGHGIQMEFTKTKYPFLISANSSLVLAEIPSTFTESLVYKKIIESSNSKKIKIALLSNLIERHLNTIIRQISFHKFEEAIHNQRKNGLISLEKIREIWINESKKSLGDNVKIEENDFWIYISHFIHSPFYVYAYAYSELITLALIQNYIQNPESFVKKYKTFLYEINTDSPDILLNKIFNIDTNNSEIWQSGIDYVSNLINELEKLCIIQ